MSNIETYIMIVSLIGTIIFCLILSVLLIITLQWVVKPLIPKKYKHLSIFVTLLILLYPVGWTSNFIYNFNDFYMRKSIINHPSNFETYLMTLDEKG